MGEVAAEIEGQFTWEVSLSEQIWKNPFNQTFSHSNI